MASLLDSLNYGGGGLLDFLQSLQQQNSFSGLPSDQAQYGAAPQYGQPMQANAQMMPQQRQPMPAAPQPQQPSQPPQMQPAPQPQGGGFLDRLSGGFQSLGNGGSILGVLSGHPTDETSQLKQAQNQTAQYLVSKQGMDPALAQSIVSDPATLRSILPSIMGVGGQTDDIKEYQFAKKEDPSLTFASFMQKKKSVSGEYSLTPQYGTNEKGETVLLQTGKAGEAIQTKLPPGVKVSSGVEKIDAGDHWILYDKRTGTPVGQQAKNIEGRESAEKRGQAQGTAQAALANGADLDAEATKKKIDEFIASPGFNQVFGSFDQYRPSWTLNDHGRDAVSRYEQLKGVAFLTAYQMLKGGGAITDIEGQKAGAAMARLNQSLGEEDAKKALNDFKDAVDLGLKKLRRAANGGVEPAASETPVAAPEGAPKSGAYMWMPGKGLVPKS